MEEFKLVRQSTFIMKPSSIKIFRFTTLLVAFICCILSAKTQSIIPANWQQGMTITIVHGPGMYPESSKIIISDSGCYEIRDHYNKQTKTIYHLTKSDLDEIISAMRINQFDQIKMDMNSGFAYDKPTNSIALNWQGQQVKIVTSSNQDVSAADRGKLSNINAVIYKILHKKNAA